MVIATLNYNAKELIFRQFQKIF